MRSTEVNFDGLIGPTHNYAGLAAGNIASQTHARQTSSPRKAALQGLAKMKLLAELGIRQAVLPPQPRPDFELLHRNGYTGNVEEVIANAHRDAPHLLAASYSASCMWTANAATVSPSADTTDGRVHFTPANLASQLHRSIEPRHTARILIAIFNNDQFFVVHDPLPIENESTDGQLLRDEGAANHTRLFSRLSTGGVEVFTYGVDMADNQAPRPKRYPARQIRQASEQIIARHLIKPDQSLLVQQHPAAIEAGVFHNDVICVGHENVLLVHECAFVDNRTAIEMIAERFQYVTGQPLVVIEITSDTLSLDDAVGSYLFNSQIVTLPNGDMAIIAPIECQENRQASDALQQIIDGDNPINHLHIVDLRQSMNNGGGPACLRLRVLLNEAELAAIPQSVRWSPKLHDTLIKWVNTHYRDVLSPDDLADPALAVESKNSLIDLEQILEIPIQER